MPEVLYHGTFRFHVESILKYGLGAKLPKRRNWNESRKDVPVYLSSDAEDADGWARSGRSQFFSLHPNLKEQLSDEAKEIVVFQVRTDDLDPGALHFDRNLHYQGDPDIKAWEYHRPIPAHLLEIVEKCEKETPKERRTTDTSAMPYVGVADDSGFPKSFHVEWVGNA